MFEKLKKWNNLLCLCTAILMVAAVIWSVSIEPLPRRISPSTIHVEEIEWDSCTQIDQDTWEYTYRLKNLINADDIVSIATYWVSADVFLDDSMVFSYDDANMDKGSCIHWIRLPLWAAGKTLHVVYSGEKKQVELSASEEAYLGNAALVYFRFVMDRAYALVFAICVCLMLLMIIYFYRLMRSQIDKSTKRGLLYLGLFMLITGIWIIADSLIMFTFLQNIAANTLVAYSTLPLFSMFITMFASEMLDHRVKFLDLLQFFYLFALIFMIVGHVMHLIPLKESLVIVHILMVASVTGVLIGGSRDLRINKNKEIRKILIGFAGLACCGMVALVLFYYMPEKNYSILYCVGLVFFTLFVVWAAYERLYRIMGHNANVMAYRRLAYRDVLTNLGNRAAFMKEQQELSLDDAAGFVVMDINDLKYTNDCFGHQAGDEMICATADCISSVFKGKGNAYRIGGDEFVVIVRNATEEYLEQLLRRLEETMEEKNKELQKSWKLKVAYGYAVHSKENNYEDLFRRADDCMYECKRRMKEAVPVKIR